MYYLMSNFTAAEQFADLEFAVQVARCIAQYPEEQESTISIIDETGKRYCYFSNRKIMASVFSLEKSGGEGLSTTVDVTSIIMKLNFGNLIKLTEGGSELQHKIAHLHPFPGRVAIFLMSSILSYFDIQSLEDLKPEMYKTAQSHFEWISANRK